MVEIPNIRVCLLSFSQGAYSSITRCGRDVVRGESESWTTDPFDVTCRCCYRKMQTWEQGFVSKDAKFVEVDHG